MRMSQQRGVVAALLQRSVRLRPGPRLAGVHDATLRALTDEVAGVREAALRHDGALRALTDEVAGVREAALRHDQAIAPLPARAVAAERLEDLVRDLRRQVEEARARAELADRVLATTAWLEQVSAVVPTVVSVIMPTRNRCELLRRAIASVKAQRHQHWGFVIVDDGSTDGTAELLASLQDPRIRSVRIDAAKHSAARNRGLEEATGDLIAYLDDDNVMGPHWLSAVAWAFDRWPEHDVVYGGRIMESGIGIGDPTGPPHLQLEAFDRRALEHHNLIDQNVLAHRTGLAEAHFDEELWAGSDWELAWRLTENRDPLLVPVVAALYSTRQQHRVSGRDGYDRAALTVVRDRIARRRRLRVLAYNQFFPLITETYIADAARGAGPPRNGSGLCARRAIAQPDGGGPTGL